MDKTYTQADIDALISQNAEESINLEFKRGDALRKEDRVRIEISKDVSAIANSDGGIIIYGIEEKDHKAFGLKFVDGNEFTKEWLEQIIYSRIQRKIEGLIIDPIRYDGDIAKTIFAVKIPRSLNAPHMTSEKKFFRRYNFMAVEMEEYEVRNSYNRQDNTQLEILLPTTGLISGRYEENKWKDPSKPDFFAYYKIDIQFNIRNTGQTIERLYKIELHIHRTFFHTRSFSSSYLNDKFRNNLSRSVGDYQIFSIYDPSPLFQNEIKSTAKMEFEIDATNFAYPITMNLFYSNGIETRDFAIKDIFSENKRQLNFL